MRNKFMGLGAGIGFVLGLAVFWPRVLGTYVPFKEFAHIPELATQFYVFTVIAIIVGGVAGMLLFNAFGNKSQEGSKPVKTEAFKPQKPIEVLDQLNEDGTQQVLIRSKWGASVGALSDDGSITTNSGSGSKRYASMGELENWLDAVATR